MLFRYIKFEDMLIKSEVFISAKNEEDVINYILENREQFELPDYFTSESGLNMYICDKDSLCSYWNYQQYLNDVQNIVLNKGLIQCKVEEIVVDVFI